MLPQDREDILYSDGKRCQIKEEEQFMMSLLGDAAADQPALLDLGCGSGEISLALARMGYSPYGLDFSKVAVEIATANGLACEEADLDSGIPKEDRSYDVVWAGDVMEHVFDPISVFKEVRRVLKPQGRFFATIPNDLHYKTRIKVLLGHSFQESVYRRFGQYKHHSFFSERLVRYMYEAANLEIVNMYYVASLPLLGKRFITSNRLFRIFSTLMVIEAINGKN
jgi:2-polyprenyl-3-methyl-5-hydroxy-6-metoxy-1,4-benzoquinol methylase